MNSNLQLLKEQLAELNSSVELYQNDRYVLKVTINMNRIIVLIPLLYVTMVENNRIIVLIVSGYFNVWTLVMVGYN